MKVEKIYIVTDAPIPVGFAPTNRILSYASGFKKNGVECEIIIFRKTENYNRISNSKTSGKVNGAIYNYLFSSTVKSKYFVKRRWDAIIGALKLLYYALFKINRNSAIIYYSTYTYGILILRIAKLFNPIILLKEESEHPSVYLASMRLISKIFFPQFHFLLFDGILVMTEELEKSLKRFIKKVPIEIIPMTVELSRFNGIEKKNDFITYIGHLNNQKDGVLLLVDAFKKFKHRNYNNYKLNICGYTSDYRDLDLLLSKIRTYNLNNDVILYQNVPNIDIPNILISSKVLVLPRPKSTQAENGFPTKLGEYLASSNPVIVSNVGEIKKYLIHKKTAYIFKPNDVESLAQGIEYVVKNIEQASKMGKEGRKIAEKYFNNITQTKKIINFIKEI